MAVWKEGSFFLLLEEVKSNRCLELLKIYQGEGESVELDVFNQTVLYRVQLVVQPVNNSILEQVKFSAPSSHPYTHTHILDDMGMGMMEGEVREETPEPSPFSTKKDMYSGKCGTQVNEKPLPWPHM